MGTTITVRGLDEELHRQLKEQARRHHRSMEAEARDLLARGLGAPAVDVHRPPVQVRVDRSGDWLDHARAMLDDAWASPDWADDWLPERADVPSRPAVELGG